jgi:hypothetical protein
MNLGGDEQNCSTKHSTSEHRRGQSPYIGECKEPGIRSAGSREERDLRGRKGPNHSPGKTAEASLILYRSLVMVPLKPP